MSHDEKPEIGTPEPVPSQQNKDTNKETPPTPANLEELKSLLGEGCPTETQNELDWLLKSTQEMVKRKGEDWVKKNRVALLRQWEYVRSLL